MRESIGALSIFSIVMTFIVLFIAYLAISINYANAFRVKNALISAIENHEGIDNGNLDFLNNELVAQTYDTFGHCPAPNDQGNDDNRLIGDSNVWGEPMQVGPNNNTARACVYVRHANGVGTNVKCPISYYKVLVFFKMDLPVMGDLLTFPIKGDTRGVYNRNQTDCVETT